MRMYVLSFVLLIFAPKTSSASIQTVPYLDLATYAGVWYEIARNPIIVEPKCACARQSLTPMPDSKIDVYNTCNKKTPSGALTSIRGSAQASDPSGAKLSVDFGLPWNGQYWVIALDPLYRYAAVTDSWGYSLYILSRTPQLDDDLYAQDVQAASAEVSVKRLIQTDQTRCTYPSAGLPMN